VLFTDDMDAFAERLDAAVSLARADSLRTSEVSRLAPNAEAKGSQAIELRNLWLALHALGWRTDRDSYSRPPAHSPTLDVLDELAGAARAGWRVTGTDLAVATTARAVIRQD
jgi:hypothetical protein